MALNLSLALSIRAQGLSQFSGQNENAEDVLFIDDGSSVNILLVPYGEPVSPSEKYKVRKLVVEKILDKSLSPSLSNARCGYFFSYDPIYDIDYAFFISYYPRTITLYLTRDGKILKTYSHFDLSTDERIDMQYL